MTVLSACQEASKLMGKGRPAGIYANTAGYELELAAIANEAATYISKRHDWQKLLTLMIKAGDGVTTVFGLAADYDRMPVKGKILSTRTNEPLNPVRDVTEWLDMQLRNMSGGASSWILLGGQLNIDKPALAAGESAKFYYVSNLIVAAQDLTTKTSFTADTDSFRLPERLLQLCIIWMWRKMKRLEYAEDMQDFEIALAQEIARDKGSHVITVGRGRVSSDVPTAYPGTINA